MTIAYDACTLNHQMLLDLTLEEAIGGRAHDRSKAQRWLTLNGPPTWPRLASGITVLDFDGIADYLDCPTADTVDLDFMAGDYSIGGWFNWATVPGEDDQHVIGRYDIDNDGWELYLYEPNLSLNLRHHHAGGATARTGAYSFGWPQGVWHFMGISRSGAQAAHHRNGVPVVTTHSVGGLIDPETCGEDLTIGVRMSKDAEFFRNMMWRPRIWGRALQDWEWRRLFNLERDRLGV